MAGIYGPIKENPDVPVTDEGRFTVTIKAHQFEIDPNNPVYRTKRNGVQIFGCKWCGYEEDEPMHPKDAPNAEDL